jgi:hypothetical protein
MTHSEPSLSTTDHSRDAVGLRYIYPVISRRAGGVSIGINLNTNNACNWACCYCQVPNLVRGGPPPIDLDLLGAELRGFLSDLFEGDFLATRVPEGMRRVVDVAFSGNGEPTAAREFPEVVECVLSTLEAFPQSKGLKKVVISNGSHVAEPLIQAALGALGGQGGELWFKIDRGSAVARREVNGVDLDTGLIIDRLVKISQVIPTWVQTCLFLKDGELPREGERLAYQALLTDALASGAQLAGIHLYTLARPVLQPGASRFAKVTEDDLGRWARGLPIPVRISP